MSIPISNRDDIATVLAGIENDYKIPCVYSHFVNGSSLPYIAYIGGGQTQMQADSTTYWRANTYQVELYFKTKDESLEKNIEDAFIASGWKFSKSDDAYIEDEGIYLIYYDLS